MRHKIVKKLFITDEPSTSSMYIIVQSSLTSIRRHSELTKEIFLSTLREIYGDRLFSVKNLKENFFYERLEFEFYQLLGSLVEEGKVRRECNNPTSWRIC